MRIISSEDLWFRQIALPQLRPLIATMERWQRKRLQQDFHNFPLD